MPLTYIIYIRDGLATFMMISHYGNLDSKFNSATTGDLVPSPALTLPNLLSSTPAESILLMSHSVIVLVLHIGTSNCCVLLGCLLPSITPKVLSLLMCLIHFICSHFKAKHQHMTITIRWPTSQTTLGCKI